MKLCAFFLQTVCVFLKADLIADQDIKRRELKHNKAL